MLLKERFEPLVVEQLRARVLTEENLEELVKLVNEELQASSNALKEQMDVLDTELRDIRARLDRHYEALETGQLDLEDLAPRIREIRDSQGQLEEARNRFESEWNDDETETVDDALVKAYAQGHHGLLEESKVTERKAFVRSFVKRLDINPAKVTIHFTLPLPSVAGKADLVEVLPIMTSGRPLWTALELFEA